MSTADHERLFHEKHDVMKRGPGYVILYGSQQSSRRTGLRSKMSKITLDTLREKSRTTVYTISEFREDVRTMIRNTIDSEGTKSYIGRKAHHLNRIADELFENVVQSNPKVSRLLKCPVCSELFETEKEISVHVDTCTHIDISSLLEEDDDSMCFDSDVSICSTAPNLDDDLIDSYVASQSYDDYISADMLKFRGLIVPGKSQISSMDRSMDMCTQDPSQAMDVTIDNDEVTQVYVRKMKTSRKNKEIHAEKVSDDETTQQEEEEVGLDKTQVATSKLCLVSEKPTVLVEDKATVSKLINGFAEESSFFAEEELRPILNIDVSQTCNDGDDDEKILTSQISTATSPSRKVIQLSNSDVVLLPPDSEVNVLPSSSILGDDSSSTFSESQQSISSSQQRRRSFNDDIPISQRLNMRNTKLKKKKKRGSRLKLRRKGGEKKKKKKRKISKGGGSKKMHKDVECNSNGWMESRSRNFKEKRKGVDGEATKVSGGFGQVDSQSTLTQLWTD